MSKLTSRTALFLGALSLGVLAAPAHAIVVTADTSATNLASGIGGTGITVTASSLSGQSSGTDEFGAPVATAVSSGTYSNASGTYGVGDGVILSSGDVNDYGDGPNTSTGNTMNYGTLASGPQEALLDPITGGSLTHYDVTQLDLTFDVDGATSTIFFNVVFGSDEYAEFVNSSYIDAFGIYLNGTNIALFDAQPVNIDHPDMAFISGTELDGLLDPTGGTGDPVMLFSGSVTPGSTGNTLTFIIADSGDNVLDSTAYISGFGNVDPGGGTPGGGTGEGGDSDDAAIPEPASLLLFGFGLAGLGILGRRRRKAA